MAIETLNDLFAALFRPAEGKQPVICQPRRPLREALFALFFPDALVRRFADKSKSNLTWFFTGDVRNKSVRRALIALLQQDPSATVSDTHRKCHQALWPRGDHPAFDAAELKAVLDDVRLPDGLETRLGVAGEDLPGAFYAADEAAALSRAILTLAVIPDAPMDALEAIWRRDVGDFEFMRWDISRAGSIRYCRMLDLQGRVERAFEGYQRLARQPGGPATCMDESIMYCRLGEMLFTGEGCKRDEKAARDCDRLGCLDANPRSWHQLSLHSSGAEAREALERAASLGYAPAIYQLGVAWYSGSARLACVRSVETARRWFQRGMAVPGPEAAQCAWMLGRICEAQGETDAAMNAYRVAQEGGSVEAAERLASLDWLVAPEAGAGEAGEAGYCLTNGAEGCNRIFLEGLQGQWRVTVSGTASVGGLSQAVRPTPNPLQQTLREMAKDVYWGGAPRFPALVIALLSDDRQQNLLQAAALLGELRRLAQSLGDRAWDFIDRVEMYVLADHDAGALLLDSALSGMGEFYFKVRLCDPALDAADHLFSGAPLFLPRLQAVREDPVRLKVIGTGETAMAVLLRAIALPMPGTLAIDVYGAEAGAMARRFRQRCPGLRGASEALCVPLPRFHECPPDEALIDALDEPEGLEGGNYYVVAAGEDAENLRLGALLRGELMKRDPRNERPPFIAVHTVQPVARWLAGSLSAGTEYPSAPWCGQYELFPFGALDMYTLPRLRGDVLERRARQAHMLYLGLPNTRDARHAAMGSYYRRQLSRDTARMTALSLPYRMHLADLSLPGWRLYAVGGEAARLGAAYTRWLEEGDHLKAAMRDEHTRRNRVLLALGWASASAEDVSAWVRRGNPGHILYPAKLDPFICPWEALEDGALLSRVRDIVHSRFPEKSVPDPRRDEEASLWDTERMVGE